MTELLGWAVTQTILTPFTWCWIRDWPEAAPARHGQDCRYRLPPLRVGRCRGKVRPPKTTVDRAMRLCVRRSLAARDRLLSGVQAQRRTRGRGAAASDSLWRRTTTRPGWKQTMHLSATGRLHSLGGASRSMTSAAVITGVRSSASGPLSLRRQAVARIERWRLRTHPLAASIWAPSPSIVRSGVTCIGASRCPTWMGVPLPPLCA